LSASSFDTSISGERAPPPPPVYLLKIKSQRPYILISSSLRNVM
jgi:hypothetical protein